MDAEKNEAQLAVVGSILLDSHRLRPVCEKFGLREDWFDEPYRRMVLTIQEMWNEQSVKVDLLTVIERMRLRGTLERSGGAQALEGCVDSTPTAAHAEHYLTILRDKGIRKAMIETMRGMVKKLDTESPELVVASASTEFRAVLSRFSIKKEKQAGEIYRDIVNGWDKAAEDQAAGIRPNIGLHLPWWRMTKLYGGLKPGLHLLGARASAGKTTMESLIRHRALADGKKTLTVEIDMNAHGLLARDISNQAGVSIGKLDFGYARHEQRDEARKVAERLAKLPQKFIFSSSNIDNLCATAYEMKDSEGLDLITVDAGQMLTRGEAADENMGKETMIIAEKLKKLGYNLGVPVYCLLHLRQAENSKMLKVPPTVNDFWGGVYWLNHAQSAALLYRQDKVWDSWVEKGRNEYEEASIERPGCNIREFMPKHRPMVYDLAKNNNGATGQIFFLMNPPYFQFLIANQNFQAEDDDVLTDTSNAG